MAIKDEEGNFSPSSLTLTPNFAIDGSQITLDSDADFSFTSLPTADAPNGIAVNSDTGVVTITSSDYFDSEVSFTATWTAEYSVGEQTFIFSITETVYTVENGSTARTLKVISDSQVFKKEKESSTLSPNYITLTTEKTNLSSETVN